MQETAILVPFKRNISLILRAYLPYRFTILTAGCLFLLILVSCADLSDEEQKQVHQALSDSLLYSTESWDVTMSLIEDGYQTLNIEAQKAIKYHLGETPKTELSGPVKVTVRDTAQQVITMITCDRATYYTDDNIFEFYENVHLIHENELEIKTSYLKWTQNDDRLSSTEFVILTTPTDSIAGYSFTSDTNFQNYVIKESSGEVTIEEE